MTKSLPVETRPPIASYQGPAFALSMLLGSRPESMPWISSTFFNMIWRDQAAWRINRFGEAAKNQLDPLAFCSYNLVQEGLFSQQRLFVQPQTVTYPSLDVLSLVRSMLDQGHYITGFYDEYYIPDKFVYRLRHMDHGYMLYGYDDRENCLLSIGYTKSRLYRPFRIPYADFMDSLSQYPYGLVKMYFLKPQPNTPCLFNAAQLETRVQEYVAPPSQEEGVYTGLACLKKFIDHVETLEQTADPFLDEHHGRVLWEHVRLMDDALHTWQRTVAPCDDAVAAMVKQYGKLLSPAESLKNLIIKHNITKDNRILIRVKQLAQEIYTAEAAVLPRWLQAAASFAK